MTLRHTITKVHLTYEVLGQNPDEYQRAIKVALCGGDPTRQMSPVAKQTYETLNYKGTLKSLPQHGQNVCKEARKLSKQLKSEPLTTDAAIKMCNTVLNAAVFYTKGTTTPAELMVVSRTVEELVQSVLDAVSGDDVRASIEYRFKDSMQNTTQEIHVNKPGSDAFEEAVDKVIHLRDYLDQTRGDV